ncbi:hypothetical protein K7G98_14120, partial [Saccharothrix sp. MB29]|nr:hypothetical protein [Saccharothrix sp. MB29]
DRGDGRPSLTDLRAWVRTSLSDLAADDLADLLLLLTELVGDALDHTPDRARSGWRPRRCRVSSGSRWTTRRPTCPGWGLPARPAPRPWGKAVWAEVGRAVRRPRGRSGTGGPVPGGRVSDVTAAGGFGETVRGTSGRVP